MMQADECEHYIRNCNRYGMNVDPSVVITLRTRWGVLQPTKAFCEGSLLPLAGILDQNSYIKCVLRTTRVVVRVPVLALMGVVCGVGRKMNLSGTGVTNVKPAAGNGNSNARVLHQILSNNKAIESLVRCFGGSGVEGCRLMVCPRLSRQDISNTGIDDDGILEICEGLKKNASVTALNVARNNFSAKVVAALSSTRGCSSFAAKVAHALLWMCWVVQGVHVIARMLEKNQVIRHLDISRNALGFHSINSLQCCGAARRVAMRVEGTSREQT